MQQASQAVLGNCREMGREPSVEALCQLQRGYREGTESVQRVYGEDAKSALSSAEFRIKCHILDEKRCTRRIEIAATTQRMCTSGVQHRGVYRWGVTSGVRCVVPAAVLRLAILPLGKSVLFLPSDTQTTVRVRVLQR